MRSLQRSQPETLQMHTRNRRIKGRTSTDAQIPNQEADAKIASRQDQEHKAEQRKQEEESFRSAAVR